MNDKDQKRKTISRKFLDLLAEDQLSITQICGELATSSDTLKKWSHWFYPEEASKYKWAVQDTRNPKKQGRPPKKQPSLLTIPLPAPHTPVYRPAQSVTALVFKGDAATVGEMIKNALSGE